MVTHLRQANQNVSKVDQTRERTSKTQAHTEKFKKKITDSMRCNYKSTTLTTESPSTESSKIELSIIQTTQRRIGS